MVERQWARWEAVLERQDKMAMVARPGILAVIALVALVIPWICRVAMVLSSPRWSAMYGSFWGVLQGERYFSMHLSTL